MTVKPSIIAAFVLALPAAAPAADPPAGSRFALVVGVEKYDGTGLRNLSYAEKDAHDLADELRRHGYAVTLLTRRAFKETDNDWQSPTAANIRDQLRTGVLAGRRPGDTVLVALSGHGAHLKSTDKLYFCPQGGKLDRPDTLLPIDEVMDALKECKANGKVLLVDACRNDPADGRAGGDARLASLTRPLVPDPPGGTVALLACSKGQLAHESDRFKNGFLMHFVV